MADSHVPTTHESHGTVLVHLSFNLAIELDYTRASPLDRHPPAAFRARDLPPGALELLVSGRHALGSDIPETACS